MGARTGTKIYGGELAGKHMIVNVTAPITATSDTITLTQATHGIKAITAIVGAVITGGHDADFAVLQVSFADLVLTVKTLQSHDGAASDEFTGTTVSITVIGTL